MDLSDRDYPGHPCFRYVLDRIRKQDLFRGADGIDHLCGGSGLLCVGGERVYGADFWRGV